MSKELRQIVDPELLMSILDSLPISVFVKDEDLRFVYSNRKHRQLMGVAASDDLIGKCDADFFGAEAGKPFIEGDQKVFSGTSVETEEIIKLQNGSTQAVLTHKARLDVREGSSYLIGSITNIDKQKSREEAYSQLAESIPVGIFRIRDDNSIAFANQLALDYLGLDGIPRTGSTLAEILGQTQSDFPAVSQRFERDFHVSNGTYRRLLVITSGWLPHIAMRRRSAVVSIVDVSEMNQLKQINDEIGRLNRELAENVGKLREAQDELIKRGKLEQLGQLTATVAHELRNPLGAVRTSTFLLERKLKDKGLKVEQQIERINKGVLRCDNIITQLLDFSRSKQLTCQPGELDQWLAQLVEEEAKRLPAEVHIELMLGLDGRTVPFDPGRLQRAVINMMSNAVEAMIGNGSQSFVSGNGPPRLTISTYFKKNHVSLRLTDNGPGIPEDILARIREPLFTTKSFGTGLGIPAIEQIAIQHGGRLDIESSVGIGTSFTVWLPLVPPGQSEEAA